MASSLFRNQPHRLQELSTRLRATQQPHMFGPSLGEGLPASYLSVPTTLRAENGHQRRVFGHGSTPSRLCVGDAAAADSEGIRRVFRLWRGVSYHRSPQAAHTGPWTGRLWLPGKRDEQTEVRLPQQCIFVRKVIYLR